MPSSPYAISLSEASREELESLSRRGTAPYQMVMRVRIVLLAAGGAANCAIAGRLGICEDTARKWRRRYWEQGLDGLADAPRPAAQVPRPGRSRGKGPGLRAARRGRDAAGPLDLPGAGPPRDGQRHRRGGLGVHRAPLAG